MNITVYIGASIDGYIADRDGGLEFLNAVPNPDGDDYGFTDLMSSVDAVLMGRVTYETILGFGVDWPYTKPVFVLTSAGAEIPEPLSGKVQLVAGDIEDVSSALEAKGLENICVDGGRVIQSFLDKDMVDQLIITRIPVLLGGGTSLFSALKEHLDFELVKSEVLSDAMVKSHYRRQK